jgi:hypothetical protein
MGAVSAGLLGLAIWLIQRERRRRRRLRRLER